MIFISRRRTRRYPAHPGTDRLANQRRAGGRRPARSAPEYAPAPPDAEQKGRNFTQYLHAKERIALTEDLTENHVTHYTELTGQSFISLLVSPYRFCVGLKRRARVQRCFLWKAPVTPSLPYTWYESPNVHFFSLADFLHFCQMKGILIAERMFIDGDRVVTFWPNLFAENTAAGLTNSLRQQTSPQQQ